MIDARRGRLPDFDGKRVEGSAALIDFNSGEEWLNAPRLGAKAVIFVEPDSTTPGEAQDKFISIPVSIPRFWISKSDAARLRELLNRRSRNEILATKTRKGRKGEKGLQGSVVSGNHLPDTLTAQSFGKRVSRNNPPGTPPAFRNENARLFCRMPWERLPSRNIVGYIRGSDPALANEWIVLHASYDGTSVVPALAPSAEATCGIAALMELARLAKNPAFAPKRSVLFIATAAHFQALAGMRAFIERHIDSYAEPGPIEDFQAFLHRHLARYCKASDTRSAAFSGVGGSGPVEPQPGSGSLLQGLLLRPARGHPGQVFGLRAQYEEQRRTRRRCPGILRSEEIKIRRRR